MVQVHNKFPLRTMSDVSVLGPKIKVCVFETWNISGKATLKMASSCWFKAPFGTLKEITLFPSWLENMTMKPTVPKSRGMMTSYLQ